MRVLNTLAGVATVLALVVIVLGAYVRLSDAGLGCPDWPGCYGQLLVPASDTDVAAANQAFPERPLESGKAWKEMIHRYLASLLGLVIVAIAVVAWRARRDGYHSRLPYFLVALVIFQGLLGMWTVTLLVKPLIVLLHLFGGLATVSLLWWFWLSTRSAERPGFPAVVRRLARIALVVLLLQIFLGGWTSTNYAALSCPDFPTCQTHWWPEMDFADAFTLWRGLGVDYEGGVLDNAARVAIHVSHRLGAMVAALVLGLFALFCVRSGRANAELARAGMAIGALLVLQLSLGIGNVVFHLPLWMATAHNGVAALLVLSLVFVLFRARRSVSAQPVESS